MIEIILIIVAITLSVFMYLDNKCWKAYKDFGFDYEVITKWKQEIGFETWLKEKGEIKWN